MSRPVRDRISGHSPPAAVRQFWPLYGLFRKNVESFRSRMRTLPFIVLLLVLVPGAGGLKGDHHASSPITVPLVRLLSRPEDYSGKAISVRGFYHREFESSALYLSEADARRFITENSFWVGALAHAWLPTWSRRSMTTMSLSRAPLGTRRGAEAIWEVGPARLTISGF
jgi:hypothetical protein